MKKIPLVLVILMLIGAGNLRAQSYSGGAGTKANPYRIATTADLKYLSENRAEWGKHFLQTFNIGFVPADFMWAGDFYHGGRGFLPIGFSASLTYIPFSGSYDGGGRSIHGLRIRRIDRKS